MLTVVDGVQLVRQRPLALIPLTVEGIIGAVLVAIGALPEGAPGAAATAAFPLDVYFDLKQALAVAVDWIWFALAVVGSVVARTLSLGLTLWLAAGTRIGLLPMALLRTLRLVVVAVPALLPAALLHFVGVAVRYAPFTWLGGLAGLVAAWILACRAAQMNLGRGIYHTGSVPAFGSFLGYVYFVAAAGAFVSLVAADSVLAVLAPALLGPLHALFLVGWRRGARNPATVPVGRIAMIGTTVAVVAIAAVSGYDRFAAEPKLLPPARTGGKLYLLQGIDSTFRSGALVDFPPRAIGFRTGDLLSYREGSIKYRASETRRDLYDVADTIAGRLEGVEPPPALLGHSQAAQILDRIPEEDLAGLGPAAVLAAPPRIPPPVSVPAPHESGPGKPGGDLARSLAGLMDFVGLAPFHLDAPASPTNLDSPPVAEAGPARMAVWALADSVWLYTDWRRPGETNLVAFTDHVGVTRNSSALRAAGRFLRDDGETTGGNGARGEEAQAVGDDENSYKGFLVAVLRYAFEPWRPR